MVHTEDLLERTTFLTKLGAQGTSVRKKDALLITVTVMWFYAILYKILQSLFQMQYIITRCS